MSISALLIDSNYVNGRGVLAVQLDITPEGIECISYIQLKVPFHCKNFVERSRGEEALACLTEAFKLR